ncbi:MAG: DUF5802 family protein [Halodesulfurarchaeum sp.]|nr:DUF5802 family protein [Halodesulfurarchaeum sp.]
MFAPFSSGYYLGRLYVAPSEGEAAVLHEAQHESVNRELYTTGEGIERLDRPLVMKLETSHFAVHPDTSVPEGALAVPEPILESANVENPPELREVLVAKAEHAERLVEFGTV